MATYRFKVFKELEGQLLLSPRAVRVKHADRLEALLEDLSLEERYTYEHIHYRVTGFQPGRPVGEVYAGREIVADLTTMLLRVSHSVPKHATEPPERVLTLEEAAERCSVSSRTVRRWCERGLVARKYRFPDGRIRVGVREALLDRYVNENVDATQQSARFSHLTGSEREDILTLARDCRDGEGLSLTAAAERIATRLGRAKETVRSVLIRHDEEHPREAIFGTARQNIDAETRQRLLAEYHKGVSAAAMARRYSRSPSSVYRTINRARAEALLALEIDYVFDKAFLSPDADDRILAPVDEFLPVAADYAAVALSERQVSSCFRAYNYLKFRICELRKGLDLSRYVRSADLREINRLLRRAGQIKEILLLTGLPLAVDVARNHVGQLVGLSDLVSEGFGALDAAIESYDGASATSFRRYARLSLMKTFARTIPRENRPRPLTREEEDFLREWPPRTGAAESAGASRRLYRTLAADTPVLCQRKAGGSST